MFTRLTPVMFGMPQLCCRFVRSGFVDYVIFFSSGILIVHINAVLKKEVSTTG